MGVVTVGGSAVWLMVALARPGSQGSGAVLLPADIVRGRRVIEERACWTCHHITEVAKARGTVGPSLDAIGVVAATRRPAMDASAYIDESIREPQAFIVRGFGPNMPTDIGATLTPQERADVVVYLLGLKPAKRP